MKIERFNRQGNFIYFDPYQKLWMESDNATCANERATGIGDLVGESCVAMIVQNGKPFLYIDQVGFDLDDPELRLQYLHNKDGTTMFSSANSTNRTQLTYASWWRTADQGIAAFGSANDEDEDVCAYILFMLNAEARRKHLIEKYS